MTGAQTISHVKFLEFAFKCQKNTKFIIRGPTVCGFWNLIFCVIERMELEENCQIMLNPCVISCPAAV